MGESEHPLAKWPRYWEFNGRLHYVVSGIRQTQSVVENQQVISSREGCGAQGHSVTIWPVFLVSDGTQLFTISTEHLRAMHFILDIAYVKINKAQVSSHMLRHSLALKFLLYFWLHLPFKFWAHVLSNPKRRFWFYTCSWLEPLSKSKYEFCSLDLFLSSSFFPSIGERLVI